MPKGRLWEPPGPRKSCRGRGSVGWSRKGRLRRARTGPQPSGPRGLAGLPLLLQLMGGPVPAQETLPCKSSWQKAAAPEEEAGRAGQGGILPQQWGGASRKGFLNGALLSHQGRAGARTGFGHGLRRCSWQGCRHSGRAAPQASASGAPGAGEGASSPARGVPSASWLPHLWPRSEAGRSFHRSASGCPLQVPQPPGVLVLGTCIRPPGAPCRVGSSGSPPGLGFLPSGTALCSPALCSEPEWIRILPSSSPAVPPSSFVALPLPRPPRKASGRRQLRANSTPLQGFGGPPAGIKAPCRAGQVLGKPLGCCLSFCLLGNDAGQEGPARGKQPAGEWPRHSSGRAHGLPSPCRP
nr:collagen alpha-1(III) chain-like [Dasypus novemcinctus]